MLTEQDVEIRRARDPETQSVVGLEAELVLRHYKGYQKRAGGDRATSEFVPRSASEADREGRATSFGTSTAATRGDAGHQRGSVSRAGPSRGEEAVDVEG